MTIASTTRKAGPFIGDGVVVAFPFAFKVFAASDLLVVQTTAGADTTKTLTADYTVALNADQNTSPGGTVTMLVSPPVGDTLTLTSQVANTQGTDLSNQGGFFPKVVNDALDRATIQIQQLAEKVGRTLSFSVNDSVPPGTIPLKSARAGKFLAFDADGNPSMASGTGADGALRSDVAASSGSALVGGTWFGGVVATVAALATSVGASLLGFIQAGTGAVLRSIQDVLRESMSVTQFGAVGDGVTDDYAAIAAAITAAGPYRSLKFPKTATNVYAISQGLKFLPGQRWVGCGGLDVAGAGTQILLTAASPSVCEPAVPGTTSFGFNPVGIYFNAQGFADAGLSLYNTSYARVDQCAASVTKAGAAAILLDSDTSKQCFFNRIDQPRLFATGVGSVGLRFTRGANANQVHGGKCGSSTRGMEFLTLSSGNLVVATDFEDNTDRHIYVDAPNNVFMATHMETAPIGFDITANGSNTKRINATYATSTTVNVQDASKIGTVLDTRTEAGGTNGDLRFGPAKFLALFLSTTTTLSYDPDLSLGTSNAIVNFFRNTITTGLRQFNIYKGDGTATIAFSVDASTGATSCGDISQNDTGGLIRKTLRRAATPATAASAGDQVNRTNPSATAPVTQWTCIAAGTPGTWQASAWVVIKGATAGRPALSAIDVGVMYLDTTLVAAGKPIWWTGTAWVDSTGTVV